MDNTQNDTPDNIPDSGNNGYNSGIMPDSQNTSTPETAKRPERLSAKVGKRAVLALIPRYRAIMSPVLKQAEVSPATYYKWLRIDPKFRARVEELKIVVEEENLDRVESKLHKFIDDGDKTSVYYYLNNKGRRRGYNSDTVDSAIASKVDEYLTVAAELMGKTHAGGERPGVGECEDAD